MIEHFIICNPILSTFVIGLSFLLFIFSHLYIWAAFEIKYGKNVGLLYHVLTMLFILFITCN